MTTEKSNPRLYKLLRDRVTNAGSPHGYPGAHQARVKNGVDAKAALHVAVNKAPATKLREYVFARKDPWRFFKVEDEYTRSHKLEQIFVTARNKLLRQIDDAELQDCAGNTAAAQKLIASITAALTKLGDTT